MPEVVKATSVQMFVLEARRDAFRESRNARMTTLEKGKVVGNNLYNATKITKNIPGF